MTRNASTYGTTLVLVAGAFLASCTDTGPVSVADDTAPAMSVQDAEFTGDHILSVSKGAFKKVSKAIGKLGGSIVRSHDEVGIIIASGLSDDAVGTLADGFVCILIDADREAALCRHYGVSGFPTIQFTAPDGRMLHRLVGRQTATKLATAMRAASKRYAWLTGSSTTVR